jgi:thioredoxin-dependent peroxiredoxin
MRAATSVLAGLVLAATTRAEPEDLKVPEHPGLVQMRGTPVTLLGQRIGKGDVAPSFRVVNASFQPVTLAEFKGKAVLISAVPSLDTPVCSRETKRFNEDAAALSGDVVLLTISTDLPFAQKRFCEAEKVERLRVLSDAVWRDFGLKYGVLIKDRGLLARAIFVIGRDGVVRYVELLPEVSHEPDYDAALSALRAAAGS